MENPMADRVINILKEEGITLTEENRIKIEKSINEIDNIQKTIKEDIDEVKKSIINSSVHLLIEGVMRDDKPTVLQILESKRDLNYFFDFTDKLNDLVTHYSSYKEDYNTYYPELKEVKSKMGLNDNKLIDVVRGILNEGSRVDNGFKG
jgi:hypothetical protein